jgi:hypothetical protein
MIRTANRATNEPAVISEVLQRALALSAVRAEGGRESEREAARSTYLWRLSRHGRDLAQAVAGNLRKWRQFFWVRKLAEEPRLADGSAKGNDQRSDGGKDRRGDGGRRGVASETLNVPFLSPPFYPLSIPP